MMQKAGAFGLLFFFFFFFLLVAAVLSESSAYVDAIDTKNAMWTVVKLLEPKAYLQFMCVFNVKAAKTCQESETVSSPTPPSTALTMQF